MTALPTSSNTSFPRCVCVSPMHFSTLQLLHTAVGYAVHGITVHDRLECVSSACRDAAAFMTKLLALYMPRCRLLK